MAFYSNVYYYNNNSKLSSLNIFIDKGCIPRV